ncbi:odorant receptor 2a [Manduca sexta]|uniref:odorant receptor 2a n=1 Tax=Manduca sexta TaxID=7130 RepID=UPI00188E8504|nr:odorant receptor 2a [Manduca sexta]
MEFHQIDCFAINMKFFKLLGICIRNYPFRFYNVYSIMLIFTFIIFYDLLCTINLLYLPVQLDLIIEELVFYFTELAAISKVLTFVFFRDKLAKILDALEDPMFQAANGREQKIIDGAKRFNKRYWKIVATVSLTSHATHILSPIVEHLFLSVPLQLPTCRYSFLSENTIQQFIYPLYLYQTLGMHCHLWFNANIDSFFLGLMILIIAQLQILDLRLRTVTDVKKNDDIGQANTSEARANYSLTQLNKCIVHFDEVGKFCGLVEDTFSMTLFMQFSMSSCILCVVLFRFTLPAPFEYYIFLGTYMCVMISFIFVPCWFGTRVMELSVLLCSSVYECDWTAMPKKFKSNLQLFVERAKRPLTITGGKMFMLSLTTFTSIMNSSYSFFTLLRNVQTHD